MRLSTDERRLLTWLACGLAALAIGTAASASPPDANDPAVPGITTAAATQTAHAGGGHTDPFALVLLELALVIVVAMLGRWLAGLCRQPAVLGELLVGVVLGNIGYWLGGSFFVLVMHLGDAEALSAEVWRSGATVADAARHVFASAQLADGGVGAELIRILTGPGGTHLFLMGTALWMFSSLGVILLLLMVGLESSVAELLAVGARAAVVAVLGIVAPFGLGLLVGMWLLPAAGTPVHLFLGATLCATSVGITARVFKDLGTLQHPAAKIVLGAAVIDDVLGLIILAVVVGIVSTDTVRPAEILRISLLSIAFIGLVLWLGERLAGVAARTLSRLDRAHNRLLFPLALAFALSWAVSCIELATIVGAFAAGLIIRESHFPAAESESSLEETIAPLERIFAPVFFVLMGMQVNLAAFLQPGAIGLAVAFSVAAVVGKLIAGLPAGAGHDRLTIGLAMVPRGEVGLIFASIGKGLGVVGDATFAALVCMIMVTTLITPPALRWSLARRAAAAPVRHA